MCSSLGMLMFLCGSKLLRNISKAQSVLSMVSAKSVPNVTYVLQLVLEINKYHFSQF